MPSWLWWGVGLLIVLLILFFVGVRLHLTTGG
jgi:hypothetical protein